MIEQDIIKHLVNVELLASELLQEAQKEADARISTASAKADAEYKHLYEKLMSDLSTEYNNAILASDDKRNKEFIDFDASLSNISEHKDEFDSFLDSVLFGK